jgi:hypothetical protein
MIASVALREVSIRKPPSETGVEMNNYRLIWLFLAAAVLILALGILISVDGLNVAG